MNANRSDTQKYVSDAGKNIRDTAVRNTINRMKLCAAARSVGSIVLRLRLYNGQKVVN